MLTGYLGFVGGLVTPTFIAAFDEFYFFTFGLSDYL